MQRAPAHSPGRPLLLLLTAGLLLVYAGLLADGESRPITAQEKAFYEKVITAFKASVPQGPQDWEITQETPVKPPTRVSVGLEEQPYAISYDICWTDTLKRRQDDDTRMALAMQAYGNIDMQASEKAMASIEKLAEELGKAVEAGDMAKVQELQAKMEKAAAPMNQNAATRDAVFSENQRENALTDMALEVNIQANLFSQTLDDNWKKDTPIQGRRHVYRTEGYFDSNDVWHEGYTYLFLGQGWQLFDEDGYPMLQFELINWKPHTRVFALVVRIQGEESRARAMMEKIRFDKLEALFTNH